MFVMCSVQGPIFEVSFLYFWCLYKILQSRFSHLLDQLELLNVRNASQAQLFNFVVNFHIVPC